MQIRNAVKITAVGTMATWQRGTVNGYFPLVFALNEELGKVKGNEGINIGKAVYNNENVKLFVGKKSKEMMVQMARLTNPSVEEDLLFSHDGGEGGEVLSGFSRAVLKHRAEGFFNEVEVVFAIWRLHPNSGQLIEEQCTHPIAGGHPKARKLSPNALTVRRENTEFPFLLPDPLKGSKVEGKFIL
jgi:hypothetical protein